MAADNVAADPGLRSERALLTLLDGLRKSAYDERDKGDRFERLVAEAMRTSPVLRAQFRDVWMWEDWPDKPASRRDLGIDIVATDAATGRLVAVQCKFYQASHRLQKQELDSFFAESGRHGFIRRVIATTADDLSDNLRDTLSGQQIPVTLWDTGFLAGCGLDWDTYDPSGVTPAAAQARNTLRPHQRRAIDDVVEGWRSHDRGKLIMACGTGKTFTALRLAEEYVGPGGSVLFMVPSIALMQQSLTEWMRQATLRLAPFTVCSDTKVGKRTASEDAASFELLEPATTDAARLHRRIEDYPFDDAMKVVFCTYQSLGVVAEAQRLGLGEFDAVICDEAHRTTGVTLAEADESAFVRIHDNSHVAGAKRVYMTATPRVFDDQVKTRAADAAAVLCSMDDEAT